MADPQPSNSLEASLRQQFQNKKRWHFKKASYLLLNNIYPNLLQIDMCFHYQISNSGWMELPILKPLENGRRRGRTKQNQVS